MTLQTLLIIIICFFALAIFVGILLITFLYGRLSVKNNAKQACVFIKKGLTVDKPIKAKRIEVSAKGSYYQYGENVVMMPTRYTEVYYCSKRMIFLDRIGQLIGLPFDKDIPLADTEKEDLIYELCSSHIGADSIRALRGKSVFSLIIVAVIAFILGAVLVFGFTQFQKMSTQKQTTTTIQQNIPTKSPIEVK